MLELLRDLLSWILLLSGCFFLIVGAIGLNRMPDVYTRLHATGVSDTAGAGLILLGLIVQAGFTLVGFKLFVLLLIFLFTAPVATHAVTRAALSVNVKPQLLDEHGRERREVLEALGLEREWGQSQISRPMKEAEPAPLPDGGGSSKP